LKSRTILLTNDDGIESPGLWAAAEALSEIGQVTVVAPLEQHTSAGRSMPSSSDGSLHRRNFTIKGKRWTAYAVGGTPGQAVRHGIYEVLGKKPDLVASGINYGENVGSCVTISGTVGAAIEGAALGVPSIAVSLQTEEKDNLSHSRDIDFSAAAHFTRLGADMFLRAGSFHDVDILKIEVPAGATPDTPWTMTSVARHYYYVPVKPRRMSLGEPAPFTYRIEFDEKKLDPDTDIHALRVQRRVSISPISIDMTSRVDLNELERHLRRVSRA